MDVDNMKTIVDAAREGVAASEKIASVAGMPVLIAPGVPGGARVLLEAIEAGQKFAERPFRRKGTATHQELASFVEHVNRFKDGDSVVFADTEEVTLTAVLDYHEKGTIAGKGQRWGEHRSVYECPLSKEWKIWTEHDGVKMSQDDFAQFIEDHLDDLASPTGNGADKDLPMPAEMLTMARNLVINSKGTFQRSMNPTTGESSLICKNENDAATSTKIPRAFALGIRVFEAGAMYRMEARLRMEVSGRPMFSYVLYRPEAILRDAFGEVRQSVIDKTSLPVFAGSPE